MAGEYVLNAQFVECFTHVAGYAGCGVTTLTVDAQYFHWKPFTECIDAALQVTQVVIDVDLYFRRTGRSGVP